jgi:hypothetical protein
VKATRFAGAKAPRGRSLRRFSDARQLVGEFQHDSFAHNANSALSQPHLQRRHMFA